MNNQFWNERYSTHDTVYGHEPNVFFREQLLKHKSGKLLLPAEGEGRNALFASQLGWQVEAFDFSEAARGKALALAHQFEADMEYKLASIQTISLLPDAYDVIGLIYVHLESDLRKHFHSQCIQAVRKGGHIILEAFSKKQLTYSSGGPRDVNMLYTLGQLLEDFASMKIIYSSTEDVVLNEGAFHTGVASVVRLVAQKD